MFTNSDLVLNGGKLFCPNGLKRGKIFDPREKAAVTAVMDSYLVSRDGREPRVKDFKHAFSTSLYNLCANPDIKPDFIAGFCGAI